MQVGPETVKNQLPIRDLRGAGVGGSLWPDRFADEEELEAFMTAPSSVLASEFAAISGDIMLLGVGGKMGPALARLARWTAPKKRSQFS
jgi:hypothetical protein